MQNRFRSWALWTSIAALVVFCVKEFAGIDIHETVDGLMDVLLVKKVTRLQVPGIIGKYKNGQYKQLGHLVRHFRTKSITIHCDRETPINLDGELRMAEVADIRLADEKIRFFYPKGLTF